MAVRRRHGPSVSCLRRRGAHLLFGSGHAGVSKGSREHAQSYFGSESIVIIIFSMYAVLSVNGQVIFLLFFFFICLDGFNNE